MGFIFTDSNKTEYEFTLETTHNVFNIIRILVHFKTQHQNGSMSVYFENGKLNCPTNYDNVFSGEGQKFLLKVLKNKAFL